MSPAGEPFRVTYYGALPVLLPMRTLMKPIGDDALISISASNYFCFLVRSPKPHFVYLAFCYPYKRNNKISSN